VAVVEKENFRKLRTKVRQEPVAEFGIRDQHGVNLPRSYEIGEESRMVRGSK
jgi:hypothetical protein